MSSASERAGGQPRIAVEGLTLAYGRFVVQQDLTFTVAPGEIFVVMGASGCGKTTLLRHMIGLQRPVRGDVVYDGRSFWEADEETREAMQRRFGVLYQGGALLTSMTLGENVALPLGEFTDLSSAEITEIVSLKLALVGLAGFEEFYPAELSGGMMKRAGLARAMALDPAILFLDEPSAGLDPVSSSRLDDLILQLRESLGCTFVVVTHELPSIFAIADTAAFLDPAPPRGRLAGSGRPRLPDQTGPAGWRSRAAGPGTDDMSKRANPTVIGVFVLVAVALVVTGILTLGGLHLFREEITYVAFFDGDVSGLSVGSPVLYRGVQVGQVSAIKIALDPGTRHDRIGVYLQLDPNRIPRDAPRLRTQRELQPLIDRGIRAQLRVVSLVTGQLSVSLDYLPNTPVVLTRLEPGLPELPTVPTQLEQYQAGLERILASIDKVDFGQLAKDITEMVRGIDGVVRSPELAGAIRTAGDTLRTLDGTLKRVDTQVAAVGERAGATLDEARELIRKVDHQVEPLAVSIRSTLDATQALVKKVDPEIEPLAASMRSTLDETRGLVRRVDREIGPLAASLRSTLDATHLTVESAQGALGAVQRTLDGESPLGDDLSQALRQITRAARSLDALGDYLERHPEALLHGKQGSEAK
jgi:phospholipid/cholesterol/gamma-HCH transport system ATP-binding protein